MDGAELEDASWSEYDDLVKQAFDKFDQSGNFSQQVLTRYKRRDTPQTQLARLVSDVRALCPVNRVADMASKTFRLPVYRYILEASSSGDDMRQFFGFGTAGARHSSLVKYALRQAVREFVQSGRIDSWSTADRGLNVINASNARVDVRPGKIECSLFEGYGLVPKYALVN